MRRLLMGLLAALLVLPLSIPAAWEESPLEAYVSRLAVYVMGEASRYSGLPEADEPPQIIFLPGRAFARLMCGQDECAVIGTYMPGSRVIVVNAEAADPTTAWGISILVHEAVHYLQWVSGRFTLKDYQDDCNVTRKIEQGAYEAQQAFLDAEGVEANVMFAFLLYMIAVCG